MPANPLTSNLNSEAPLSFQDWGLIDYSEALERMMNLVEEVASGLHGPGVLVFCSHPPIVTLGRQTQASDVFAWTGKTLEVSRGGRATYHGPSQLVVYPVMNLKNPRKGRVAQEIAGFIRLLEDGIVEALAAYGVSSTGKSLQKKNPRADAADETGVWVGPKKIASLGIAVKKWISFHGAAINLDQDSKAFAGMNPCGFQTSVMVSLEEILGKPVDRRSFEKTLRSILERSL